MGRTRETSSALLWVFLVLISNNLLVLPVFSAPTLNNNFEDQKNFFSFPADPHLASGSQHHGSSHGGTPSGQSNCSPVISNPPTHHRGGSGSGGSGSGGYYPKPTPNPPSTDPTPTPSSPPACVCSPPPSSGGSGSGGSGSGGYYHSPPTTPVSPSTPLVPSPPIITPITPITPVTPSPLVPIIPRTPSTPFDPNTPPFPCTYWGNNPALIFGVLGWWATVGAFGVATLPGLSTGTSLQQVLTNRRNDGYSALYREGAASLLNSVAAKNFYFSTKQVKDSFLSSLASDKAAAHQARLFKLANEGRLKKNY